MAEDAGAARICVLRGSDENIPATVDFATSDGTATNGLNYTATNGTLVFAAGVTNRTIMVPLLNDGVVGGDRVLSGHAEQPHQRGLGIARGGHRVHHR